MTFPANPEKEGEKHRAWQKPEQGAVYGISKKQIVTVEALLAYGPADDRSYAVFAFVMKDADEA